MAGSLNKVTLIGHLGGEPEIRTTSEGKEIVTFSMATTESWRDKASGEKRERTEWHRIVVFSEGLVAIIKQYIHKGSKIYLEGSLQTRKWTDQAGVEKYTTEIVVNNFGGTLIMLGNANHNTSGGSGSYAPAANKGAATKAEYIDDDIPF